MTVDKEIKVLYFPSFFYGAKHGGYYRTKQIYNALISEHGKEAVKVESFSLVKLIKNPTFLFYLVLKLFTQFKHIFSFNIYRKKVIYGAYIKTCLSFVKPDKVVLEQAPGVTLYLADEIHLNGYKYDLYPHNVEFCVPQSMPDLNGYFYSQIRRSYENAERIYAISDFDKNIISIFNPSVEVYRYRYVKNINSALSKVVPKNEVIILGSIANPPSKLGMIRLLTKINSTPTFFEGYTFKVVGFKTESLKEYESSRVAICGSLTTSELENILLKYSTAMIYQFPTTGWLTRIDELLAYGFDIYINSDYLQSGEIVSDSVMLYDI